MSKTPCDTAFCFILIKKTFLSCNTSDGEMIWTFWSVQVHNDKEVITATSGDFWKDTHLDCFLVCLFFEQMPNLPAKAEHVSEQLDIRVLERSLLSGQQCQETFPPLSERGLHSYCFVEGRAADHRGNATRPLLSAVFLHGPVDTVTHIQGHKESYRCCANSNRPSLNKQGWHTHHFLNTVNPL